MPQFDFRGELSKGDIYLRRDTGILFISRMEDAKELEPDSEIKFLYGSFQRPVVSEHARYLWDMQERIENGTYSPISRRAVFRECRQFLCLVYDYVLRQEMRSNP